MTNPDNYCTECQKQLACACVWKNIIEIKDEIYQINEGNNCSNLELLDLKKSIDRLNDRVENNLCFINKQIADESKRIDEIEQKISQKLKADFIVLLNAARERTDEILEIENRLQKLEEVDAAIENGSNKKPHVCPLCEGGGYGKPEIRPSIQSMSVDGIQLKQGESFYFKATCRACEGKGILWG